MANLCSEANSSFYVSEEKQYAKETKGGTDREKALLRLMQTVAATANDADSLEDAMQEAVCAVCAHTGWPLGHVYRMAAGGEDHLVPTDIWSLPNEEQFDRFRAVTQETTFALGEGLPGQVAQSGRPAWIRDVTDAPDFTRTQVAENLGVKGAFGVPVRHDGKTVAVLEFLSAEEEEPDEQLLGAMDSIGVQLSRVAERERARKALRQSEERYRRFFEGAQEGIVLSTPEGEILDANPAAQRILGYSRDELLEMTSTDLYVDPAEREEGLQEIADKGALRDYEVRVRRKEGTTIICQLSSTPHRGVGDEVDAYQTFIRDVTDRREAEEKLRQSEQKYRRLFEESQEGIMVTAPDGTIRDVNSAICELSGYTSDELLGTNVAEFYDRSGTQRDIIRRLQKEGALHNYELSARRKNGAKIICRVSATAWRDAAGEIEAVQSFVRDITEEKRIQDALRESEKKFRVLAEKSLVGIAMLQDGRYTYVNPALASILGYTPDELEGQSPELVIHPDDWPAVQERLQKRFEDALQEAHYQARMVTKEGEIHYVEVRGSRIQYQGEPTILGTVMDITEQKQTQEELRRLNKTLEERVEERTEELRRLNETLEERVEKRTEQVRELSFRLTMAEQQERRRISHILHDDLQQRLYGIQMKMTRLRHAAQSKETGQLLETADMVETWIGDAIETTRQLSVDLSPPVLEADGLADVLGWLQTQMKEMYGLDVELEAEHPFYLPDEDQRVLLFQVVRELLFNVVKHAGVDHAAVELADESGQVVIRVSDAGRGFDPDALQPDEGEASFGLTAARERLELFGGYLNIESAPGEGTRAVVRAPLEFYRAGEEPSTGASAESQEGG